MRNYIQGACIHSLDEMYRQEFIFYKGKVYHRGWFRSWSLSYANALIANRLIYEATRREQVIEQLERFLNRRPELESIRGRDGRDDRCDLQYPEVYPF